MFGLFVALLFGRGSLPLRLGGSPLSLGEGSDLVMSLKSCGIGEGPVIPILWITKEIMSRGPQVADMEC